MPLPFLLRLLARIAFLGAAGAFGRRTMNPPWRTPGQQVPGGAGAPSGIPEGGVAGAVGRALAGRLGPAVDVGRILLHLVAILVFLAATLTVGT
ncbi:MAG TPA: hypothetical protein VFO60_04700, partial [Candidatus Dormibacteraeota bacterium]|nr:hypothetical protein [Candidatus Dormibacteraeota bacterium]